MAATKKKHRLAAGILFLVYFVVLFYFLFFTRFKRTLKRQANRSSPSYLSPVSPAGEKRFDHLLKSYMSDSFRITLS